MKDIGIRAVLVKRLPGAPFQGHPHRFGHLLHPDIGDVGAAINPVQVHHLEAVLTNEPRRFLAIPLSGDANQHREFRRPVHPVNFLEGNHPRKTDFSVNPEPQGFVIRVAKLRRKHPVGIVLANFRVIKPAQHVQLIRGQYWSQSNHGRTT
jgi:hypothetical protein